MQKQNTDEKRLKLLYLLLRISFGVIYFWFGILKVFPGMSPAEDLAMETIHVLTFGLIPDQVSIILLATWEVLLGLLFFSNLFQRFAVRFALLHMACTFLPLVFFPALSFSHVPYAFTLVGQYIVKNLVFIVALLMMMQNRAKPA